MIPVEKKEFPGFSAEVLSVGKNKKDASLNEDRWVVIKDTFAVIDGATSRVPVKFGEKTGGQFTADVVCEVLRTTDSSVNGLELIKLMTASLNQQIEVMGMRNIVEETAEARPAALFIAARVDRDKLIITSLGDVGCRVNGETILYEPLKIEEVNVTKRVQAMREAKEQNPNISDEDLLRIGADAADEGVKIHARSYYNNPDSELGHGIIDGRLVPEKYVRVHEFDLEKIRTIELFSDGYFKLGEKPTIESWEQSFEEIEREDPLKYGKYPGIKGSAPDHFTDDRTILIVHRNFGQ